MCWDNVFLEESALICYIVFISSVHKILGPTMRSSVRSAWGLFFKSTQVPTFGYQENPLWAYCDANLAIK